MQSSRWATQTEPSFSQPTEATSDEFAQSRGPDNLFDDDFDPVEEQPQGEAVKTLQSPPDAPTAPSRQRNPTRGTRRGGSDPSNAPRPVNVNEPTPITVPEDAKQSTEVPRTEAVRGDRSGTGGIKKTKLTEVELSERMEKIKLKNASLEEAHARAEADEALFNQREAEAQEKRKQERQNRQQMMGEREKNRLRKLKAVGGREWDAEKAEIEADENSNRSQFRRGAYGGVAFDRQSMPSGAEVQQEAIEDPWPPVEDTRGGYRGRGRGRGQGSRGRGRGDMQQGGGRNPQRAKKEQTVPKPEDFPMLVGDAKAVKSSSGWGETTPSQSTGWGDVAPAIKDVTGWEGIVPASDAEWGEDVPVGKEGKKTSGLDIASWAEQMS